MQTADGLQITHHTCVRFPESRYNHSTSHARASPKADTLCGSHARARPRKPIQFAHHTCVRLPESNTSHARAPHRKPTKTRVSPCKVVLSAAVRLGGLAVGPVREVVGLHEVGGKVQGGLVLVDERVQLGLEVGEAVLAQARLGEGERG